MQSTSSVRFNPDAFWTRFRQEAHALANTIETGDCQKTLGRLNDWLHDYDLAMNAAVELRNRDCRILRLSGSNQASIAGLLSSAPSIHGWRVTADIPSDLAVA